MKKLSFLFLILTAVLLGCMSSKKEKEPQDSIVQDSNQLAYITDTDTTKVIDSNKVQPKADKILAGSDQDEHGCRLSAGYSWSVLKKKCIRAWETGIKLNQIDKTASATFNAAIILSDNKKQVELFIHTEANSILLNKIEGAYPVAYAAKDYILTETPEGWTLSKGDKEIYNNF